MKSKKIKNTMLQKIGILSVIIILSGFSYLPEKKSSKTDASRTSGITKKALNLDVFKTKKEKKKGQQMLENFVGIHIDSLMEKRQSELNKLKTPEDWLIRQKEVRKQLPGIFGRFPEKTPLNAKITGKLDRDGYSIEKVIYESQPNYYVTANLYIPKDRQFPVPAIIFTCGHSKNGKAYEHYHKACLGLVLKGYVVLAFDPMGQGERSEYFNKEKKKNIIPLTTGQHTYLGKTSFLVDWTLAGLRIWDGIRSIDYLISRPEVDKSQLGVLGNSGGGQMAFLIAAADERIKVCVAAHPAGPMESRYLKGFGVKDQSLIDREIMSLIAPRPCRIVVGQGSGEEPRHKVIYKDMQLFYEGYGCLDHVDFTLVDGAHNLKLPKREASYEWFNKWFNKEEEGMLEPELHPEDEKDLWCTESGFSLISLGGETGQTLNAKRLEKIYNPSEDNEVLKKQIAQRIGLKLNNNVQALQIRSGKKSKYEHIIIEKFTYLSEKSIVIPSVLFKPQDIEPGAPVYLYISDLGKPKEFNDSDLPVLLAKNGNIVMAIDVRGTGETSPVPPVTEYKKGFSEENPPNVSYQSKARYIPENLAIQSTSFDRTMIGMRTLDILRGIEVLSSRKDIKDRKIILAGNGSAGFCALLATVFDSRVSSVVIIGTLPSLKPLITNQYYNIWDYFWIPGVLRDFDIPDLARLISPKPQVWIDPVNVLGEKYEYASELSMLDSYDNIHFITPKNRDENIIETFSTVFNKR